MFNTHSLIINNFGTSSNMEPGVRVSMNWLFVSKKVYIGEFIILKFKKFKYKYKCSKKFFFLKNALTKYRVFREKTHGFPNFWNGVSIFWTFFLSEKILRIFVDRNFKYFFGLSLQSLQTLL